MTPTSPLVAAPTKRTAIARPGTLHLITDAPYEMWSRTGTKVHVVAFDEHFRAVAGAAIFVGKKRVGATDHNGTLIFPWRGSKGTQTLSARKWSGGRWHQGKIDFESYRRTDSFAQTSVYLYTDRLTYRPGEKLRARVLAFTMKRGYRPARGQVELILRGPRGDVHRQELTLDPYGTASSEIDLTGLPPFRYRLSARFGDADHGRRITVAHFKRPALEIKHDLPSYFTPRTRSIHGRVRLLDARGLAARAGHMVVTARSGTRILARRKIRVTGQADHEIAFNGTELIGMRKKLAVGGVLFVQVDVTDADGRTSQSRIPLRYVANPYTAVIELDQDEYRPGERVTALVKVTDLDHVAVTRKRIILRAGPRRLTATTNARGVASFRFRAVRPKNADELDLEAFASDVKARLAEASVQFSTARSMATTVRTPQVVQGGWVPVTIRLQRGYRPVERIAHLDVTDYSGAIVAATTARWRLRAGRWEARASFRAPSWGSMLLTIFSLGIEAKHARRFYRGDRDVVGLLVDGKQLTVHPKRRLQLTLRGVPAVAAPGSTIRYNLSVRGPRGRPTDATVGAQLVDRNVLALGDPLAKVPPYAYLYNPRRRVMATTGSKILTWPVVSRTWGCSDHQDVALPPFRFLAGGCVQPERGSGSDDLAKLHGVVGSGGGGGGIGFGGMGGSGSSSATPKTFSFSLRASVRRARPAAMRMGPSRRPPPRRYRIRRRFAATAYWASALRARQGWLRHRFTLPDLLSRQELIIVASDRRGGVGVLRRTVRVAKPVAVAVDLPPRAIEGDTLAVVATAQNRTSRGRRLRLSVVTRGFQLLAPVRSLWVPAGGSIAVPLRLRARRPGTGSLALRLHGAGTLDAVERRLTILPAGLPVKSVTRGQITRGRPARFTVKTKRGDRALQAQLQIDFPVVMPVVSSVARLLTHPSLGGDTSASLLRSAALFLLHAEAIVRARPGLRARGLAFLGRGIAYFRERQLPSGAFPYWRIRRPDPYHTAYVLETMLDMQRAGAPVPQAMVRRAAQYLLRAGRRGNWPLAHLSFWEGKRKTVRTGQSAEIFRALARAGGLLCDAIQRVYLGLVTDSVSRLLASSQDPRTIAAVTSGLDALGRRCPGALPTRFRGKQRTRRLAAAATRLLRLRDRTHWEPSWFSAYGGTLEATAAAAIALHRLDPKRHAGQIRQAMRYLLSRRNAWGAWHNERGTAETIRALLITGAVKTRKLEKATVIVRVGGKVWRRVAIDPRDPYGSAINLRHLVLDRALSAGANRIEVHYDGLLRADVRLLVRRWPARSTPRRPGRPASGLRATLAIPARVKLGATVAARVGAVVTSPTRGSAVSLALPSTLAVDRPAIAALLARGRLIAVRRRGRVLTLHLPPFAKRHEVTLQLRATSRGTSAFLAPRAVPLSNPTPPPTMRRVPFVVY